MAWINARIVAALLATQALATAAQDAQSPRIDWKSDYQESIALAEKLKKPVLIDFFATWCGPCRMMDEQTFTDPDVIEAMAEFVCIKVDVDIDEKTAFAYGIRSIPRTVVLNIHGEVVGDRVGFMERDGYLAFLKDVKEYTHRKVDGTVIKVPPEEMPEPVTIAAESDIAEVMKYLANPMPKVREEAQQALLALDPTLVERWMRQALTSAYLGERIAAKETLAKIAPELYPDFDPWAAAEERAKRLTEGR